MPTTEIKPVGLDRTDPQSELRRAFINVIDGLYAELGGKTSFGVGKTSAIHLRWMCEEILRNIRTFPVDKIGRWVGFIQGVMAANGVLDVEAERDRTRPIFTDAYRKMARQFRAQVIVNGQCVEVRWGYPDTYMDLKTRAFEEAQYPWDATWRLTAYDGYEVPLNQRLEPAETRTQKPLYLMPPAGIGA